jgi:hypothetical protein
LITSSACTRSVGGTSKPRTFAVFKVFGRRLHGKIGWIAAAQDAIDVGGRLPVQLGFRFKIPPMLLARADEVIE